MKNNNKLIYWDSERYEYRRIESEHVQSIDTIKNYFSLCSLDELMDENGEFIIYKLAPFARVTKNVEYNLKAGDE